MTLITSKGYGHQIWRKWSGKHNLRIIRRLLMMPWRIRRRYSVRKCVLRNFAKIHRKTPVLESCVEWSCNVIKKETLVQVFSCEFCEISKNTFFTEHLWWLLLKWVHIKLSRLYNFQVMHSSGEILLAFIAFIQVGAIWINCLTFQTKDL